VEPSTQELIYTDCKNKENIRKRALQTHILPRTHNDKALSNCQQEAKHNKNPRETFCKFLCHEEIFSPKKLNFVGNTWARAYNVVVREPKVETIGADGRIAGRTTQKATQKTAEIILEAIRQEPSISRK
jgi:hypothetical protein